MIDWNGQRTARPIYSGNAALDFSTRPGFAEAYDRGELLWLVAQAVSKRGMCLAELARAAELTPAEVADCRSMID
jgi:hypothetical protein